MAGRAKGGVPLSLSQRRCESRQRDAPSPRKLRWRLHSGTQRLSAPVAPQQKLPPPRALQQQTAAKRAKGAAGAARLTARLPPTPQQHQAAVQEQEE